MPGLVLVTGRNGAGKTNLLEALHVGSQGFSPRTRADGRLVRFGEQAARVALEGVHEGATVATEVKIRRDDSKIVRLNGAELVTADELRTKLVALVFTPDRLAVVKGGPLVRRAYLDRMLGRLSPARAELPREYARALAQRNAALRLTRAGRSTRAAVEPWTQQVASLGSALDSARSELVSRLAPGFAAHAAALGLATATVRYEAEELTAGKLEARLDRDIERGTTGLGPHLRDAVVAAAGQDLRSFGSQGEQRAAVLALTLAEAALLVAARGAPPLLLLDDVFSELDRERRRALLESLPRGGQTLVTATSRDLLPADGPQPAQVVAITPGEARSDMKTGGEAA